MTNTPSHDFSFDDAGDFIVALGKAAHSYGVSSVRLEAYLSQIAQALSLNGMFIVTPDFMNVILWTDDDPTQHSRAMKMPPANYDMSKLAAVGNLVHDIEASKRGLQEGSARLSDIERQPPLYGVGPIGLGYALSGLGFAVMLGLSPAFIGLAAVLSLLVYGVVLLSGHLKWLAKSLEITAAAIVGGLACMIAILLPGGDPLLLTLCGLIVLVPGLGLTQGLAEITAAHTISGFQRLVTAILCLLRLFIGTAIGVAAITALWPIPPIVSPPAIPAILVWVFTIGMVVGLAVVFQVPQRSIIWAALGGVVTFAGVQIGNQFGYWQGSFLGAAALGTYANLFAIRLHQPASMILLTGIMILVPGATAFRGLAAAVEDGATAGLSAEWHVLVIIVAIISGLVAANILVPPKRTL
ncbi:MAG: threonine/serine exporter family protein [Anderseniella sp.]